MLFTNQHPNSTLNFVSLVFKHETFQWSILLCLEHPLPSNYTTVHSDWMESGWATLDSNESISSWIQLMCFWQPYPSHHVFWCPWNLDTHHVFCFLGSRGPSSKMHMDDILGYHGLKTKSCAASARGAWATGVGLVLSRWTKTVKATKATCNPMICELPAFWAHAVCWFFRTWTLRGCRVSMRFFLNAIKPPAPPMSRWPTTWHDHQEGLQNNLFNYFQFPNWLDNLKAEQARSPFIPPVNDRAAASVATGWG